MDAGLIFLHSLPLLRFSTLLLFFQTHKKIILLYGAREYDCSGKSKALFTSPYRRQNFRPSLLRLVNNCVESIYLQDAKD